MTICTSVIVAYESLSCPLCEKMDLKIIQSWLERVQFEMHKNAGKPKNLWDLKDFFEEQPAVHRTNMGLVNNYH